MKNRLLVSVVALEVVLAGAFGILRYQALDAAAHAPITFGFIGPLSGDMAAAGLEDQRAKQLAVDELNKAGGIDGHPIIAVWQNGACEVRTAELAAQELVGNVTAIFTGPCAIETLGAAAVTQPARIPLVTSTSPGKAVSYAGDLVYRMTYSDASEGEMIAGYLAKNQAMKSVAILSGTSEAEKQRREGFVRETTVDGVSISIDQFVAEKKTITPSLLVSIQRAKPEAIYLNVDDPEVAEQLIKEFGWYTINVPVVVTEESGQWDGVLVSGEYLWSTTPAAAALLVGYEAAYGEKPEDPGLVSHAYDSVYVLADAIEHAGTDARDIQAYLDGANMWETSFGTTWFDTNGDAIYPIHVGDDKFNL